MKMTWFNRMISFALVLVLVLGMIPAVSAAEEFTLTTDKEVYTVGEDIVVTATGNSGGWVGLYKKSDSIGSVVSIYWYWLRDYPSGEGVVIQNTTHNSEREKVLAPGEYVVCLFPDSGYNVALSVSIRVESGDLKPLTAITYQLEDPADGFANGTVTVTKESDNGATDCVMFWADENGKPLEGYTSLAKFKLTGETTVHQMYTHTIIPAGARKLIAYAAIGNELSGEAVSADLPENCGYPLGNDYDAEFQIVSDTHVRTDNSIHNTHFLQLLEDIRKNSPESIGLFINGDVTDTGYASEYEVLLELYEQVRNKGRLPEVHLAIGNHDWMQGNPGDQFQYYAKALNKTLPTQPKNVYYDEVVSGYHFIYLGGEQSGGNAVLSAEQLEWFDSRMAEIAAEDPDTPVFVLLHQPLYDTVAGTLPGQGWHGVANESSLKAILKKYPQIILFGGHGHWELNSEQCLYKGDAGMSVALNTASVGYLWSSYNVRGGEHADGSHGYYVRVYGDKVVYMGRDIENGLFIPSAIFVVQRNKITTAAQRYCLAVGQTLALEVSSMDQASLSYVSSDSGVATVDKNGTVKAVAPGTVQITITALGTDTTVIDRKTVSITVVESSCDSHVWGEGEFPADQCCTEPGEMTYYCKNCDMFKTEWVPAPGHSWDEGKVTQAPGLNRSGEMTYTCTRCGQTRTEEIPMSEDPEAVRIYGDNRFQTAFKVAREMKGALGVDKFDTIIVASGSDFADALSGSYLASVKNAPILLSYNESYNSLVTDFISANLAYGGTVYILGGTAAVPKSMEKGLEFCNVIRLAGANRFETNLKILEEAGVGDKEILVCTGTEFADSLSASATGLPILLVYKNLTDGQKEYLKTLKGNDFCIIGGENAVSASLETAIKAYGETTRLAGGNRLATSVMVAERYFTNPESAVIAYGWNYPDGLCGGALAHAMDAPLLLTHSSAKNYAVTENYMKEQHIFKGYVLGGPGLVSDEAVRSVFGMAEDARIQTK